jgi:hypothetical protein
MGDDEVVKGRPEIVDKVSYHGREHGMRLVGDVQGIDPASLSAPRLSDEDDFVRMSVRVPLDLAVDVHHVLLRSLDLAPPGVIANHDMSAAFFDPREKVV